jgi:hypothetical protein
MSVITPEQSAANRAARDALNSHPLVRNTYMASEKRPPSYERKWWLRVLYVDWSSTESSTYDDRATATGDLYRMALQAADRLLPQEAS